MTEKKQLSKHHDAITKLMDIVFNYEILSTATEQDKRLLRLAFEQMINKRSPHLKLLAKPRPWTVYKARSGDVDKTALIQCFGNAVHYHLDFYRSSGYLGTMFNARFKLAMCYEEMTNASKEEVDRFCDLTDTFILVLMHAVGMKSPAVANWSRALKG